MASEAPREDAEHAAEPPAAPVQGDRTFQWGSILAAVKDQLPSLDSDSSTVSTEILPFFPLDHDKKLSKARAVILPGILGWLVWDPGWAACADYRTRCVNPQPSGLSLIIRV